MARKPTRTRKYAGSIIEYDNGEASEQREYEPWVDVPAPSPPDPPGPRLLTGFGVDNPLRTEIDRRSEFFPASAPQEYQSGPVRIQGWRSSWGFKAGPDGLEFAVVPTSSNNRHGMASLKHGELVDEVSLQSDVRYVIEWAHQLTQPPIGWVNSWQTWTIRDSGEGGNILASFIKPGDEPQTARVHFTHQPRQSLRQDSDSVIITEWPAKLKCKVEVHQAANLLNVWYAVNDGALQQVMALREPIGSANGLGRQGVGVYTPRPYAAAVPYYRISVVD